MNNESAGHAVHAALDCMRRMAWHRMKSAWDGCRDSGRARQPCCRVAEGMFQVSGPQQTGLEVVSRAAPRCV